MLRRFGVPVEESSLQGGGTRISVAGPGRLRGCSLRVAGDFSAAAFFLVAAAARPGARVTVAGVGLNDSRIQLLDTLKQMGAVVEMGPIVMESGEPVGEVPAWAVAASAARGTSRLRGAEELRLKECDRLHALAVGLQGLGVRVEELPDGLDIHGGPVAGGLVRAFGDHRIVMAFAILGTRASGPVTVDDAACIATSYPGFAGALRSLGGRVVQAAGEEM